MELSVELAEAVLYADDGIAQIIKEFNSGTLTLGVDDIGLSAASELTGAEIDSNGVLVSTSEDDGKPVAVGFRAKKANGKYRYFWLYRVKFAVPATNLETKGESINFQTPSIEGTVMRRNKVDGKGRHPWKAEVSEDDSGVNTTTIGSWYKEVYEPAYARVSTDSRRQEDSLENQMETYERMITGNPEYEFIGVFADQGISGYCENRPQFQRMMEKARAGEIDLIITKSISRFARNTVTVLKFARELKELGVGIFFEEQNINTLSGDGEMMLAVLASFAQEESRSMSENNKWSIRKKFERGEVMITTSRFLGYDKNEYGDLIVNRKEAEIVSLTFDLYLLNVGSSRIGELLDYLGVKTVTGTTWESGTINGMLCNEKYKGDFHLQKYYTPENKRNHTRKNNGEVQSYYISENHEPIVSPEVWEKVQEVREQRKRDRNIGQDSTMKFQNRYPLSGMLICPYCGKTLRRRQVYKKKIQWLCSTYIEKGVKACKGIRIDDAELQGLNITEQTVIEEVVKNGKKHYCYTSKADFDCGIRNSTVSAEIEDGSVLPSVNRPRRTVIKL